MEKSLSFLILICIGVVFWAKVSNKEQVGTIKNLILTIALPAVILSALLKINLTASLIYSPLMVLGCNFLLFLSVRYILPISIDRNVNTDNRRTLMSMLPSFLVVVKTSVKHKNAIRLGLFLQRTPIHLIVRVFSRSIVVDYEVLILLHSVVLKDTANHNC